MVKDILKVYIWDIFKRLATATTTVLWKTLKNIYIWKILKPPYCGGSHFRRMYLLKERTITWHFSCIWSSLPERWVGIAHIALCFALLELISLTDSVMILPVHCSNSFFNTFFLKRLLPKLIMINSQKEPLLKLVIECYTLFSALLESASHVVGLPLFIAPHLLFQFKQISFNINWFSNSSKYLSMSLVFTNQYLSIMFLYHLPFHVS